MPYKPAGNVWLVSQKGRDALGNLAYESWRWTEVTLSAALLAAVEKAEATYLILSNGNVDDEVAKMVKPRFRKEIARIFEKFDIENQGYAEDATVLPNATRGVPNPSVLLTLL